MSSGARLSSATAASPPSFAKVRLGYLAGHVARKVVDDLEMLWMLVACNPPIARRLEGFERYALTVLGPYDGESHFAPLRVRNADDRAFGHRRMGEEHRLDLDR